MTAKQKRDWALRIGVFVVILVVIIVASSK